MIVGELKFPYFATKLESVALNSHLIISSGSYEQGVGFLSPSLPDEAAPLLFEPFLYF